MKASVYTQYGPPDVLHIQEMDRPVPKDNEVLIRVRATTVNYGDLIARNFGNVTASEFNMSSLLILPARLSFGWNSPKKPVLGSELSGTIEGVGEGVKNFGIGDEVMAYSGMDMGAYAEYLCMPASGMVARKPASMSFVEACTLPYGGTMALSLLQKAGIKKGDNVLINGASGGIGSVALQLARYYGAEVTGVCGTPRLDYIKALGADHIIDYTKEDFTQNGRHYDVIFDILGRTSLARCKGSLSAGGRYLLASFKLKQLFQMLSSSLAGGPKVICAMASEQPRSLITLQELADTGILKTVVDRTFPLEQAADAHRYAESGQRKGAIVITI